MESKHLGSCLCGGIAFEIEGEFQHFYLCHCEYCRKDTGSAHASNLFSTSAKLNWTSGKELVRTFRVPQTRHQKSFCQVCGSAVPTVQVEAELLVTPAGCLDTELKIDPTSHIFISSRASWDRHLEEFPMVEGLPE